MKKISPFKNIKYNQVVDRIKSIKRKTVLRTLLGLSVFGFCAANFRACNAAVKECAAKEKQKDLAKATLIEKQYLNPQHVHMYFDMDDNPKTTEAFISSQFTSSKRTMAIHDVTNGTTMTIGEWKKLTGDFVHYK